jgi:hypothetical protein
MISSAGLASRSNRWRLVGWVIAVVAIVLVPSLCRTPSRSVRAAAAEGSTAAAAPRAITYTETQAGRGQALFRRHCEFCHHSTKRFTIADIVDTFPTVYHLFERIRENMPAWDIDAVSAQQKVDIVAFLMRANGFPAGREELSLDVEAMKRMRLAKTRPWTPEPGFEMLFNGTDFTNFKFLFGMQCAPPPGCGKTDPNAFSITNGVIVAHGRQHGYMYTEKKYLDFDWRLDYRIVPPADADLGEEPILTGGGFFLFVPENKVWPDGIEIEGDNERMVHAYGLGKRITDTWDQEALLRANHGPGPWNSVQIRSKGGQVDVLLNGTLVTHISAHPFSAGHLGIQYQGGTWMYRRVRIKPE